jgi:lysozyme
LRKQLVAELDASTAIVTAPAVEVTEKTLGIDVSYHQGNLDWPSIRASGVHYCFAKSTEGQGYVDPQWEKNALAMKRAGVLVGSYHFLWPSRDSDAQAEHYFKVAGNRCDLPPVLDLEVRKGCHVDEVAYRACRFVEATEALWGRKCIIYTYPSFFAELLADGALSAAGRYKLKLLVSRDLWIAHYGVPTPRIPWPWKAWKFWQFDGDGGRRLPSGTDSDFNHFAGSLEDLRQYCFGAPPDTQPDTPTSKSSQRIQAVKEPGPSFPDGAATPLGWADRAEMEAWRHLDTEGDADES